MATATTEKGLSAVELQLLNDFRNVVAAREYNEGVKVKSLSLSYDQSSGYVINLSEYKVEPAPLEQV